KVIKFVIPRGDIAEQDDSLTAEEKSDSHWSNLGKVGYKKVKYTDKNGNLHSNIFIATHKDYVETIGGNKYKITSNDDKDEALETYNFRIKEDKLDKLVNCRNPIKAGASVGYTGLYAFEKQPNYRAAHVEVFTAQDPELFLSDSKDDGLKEKNYFKINAGAKLKKAFPGIIPGGSQIKVTAHDATAEVKLVSSTKKVMHKDLVHKGKNKDGKDYYIPSKGKHLKTLNEAFGGLLKSDSILVLEEEITPGELTRKVKYEVSDAKKYWIFAGHVPRGTTEIRDLTNDLTEIYEEQPSPERVEDTIEKEIILSKKDARIVKDPQGVEWYQFKIESKKGWIKNGDAKLEKISAYNWKAFGFKILIDSEDKYIYDPKSPPTFLKEVWSLIDVDNSNILTTKELQNALKKPEIARQLSHMVCKHTSEWHYSDKWASFKATVKELYTEGIEAEEDGALRKEFENKRDETLNALEKRVQNLSFWNKIKPIIDKKASSDKIADEALKQYVKTLVPEENKFRIEILEEKQKPKTNWLDLFSTKKKEAAPAPSHSNPSIPTPLKPEATPPSSGRSFPSGNAKVYHFHPIAFVGQMRKMILSNKYVWANSALGNLIGKKESGNNYNICNQTKGGLKVIRNITVVETTVKEILAKQINRDIFAVGRFQLIPPTLKAAVDSLHIDLNQNMDEEMQNRIFDEYLLKIKRPKIIKFLEGDGKVEEAMFEAAKEWASIGVEKGRKISKDRIAEGGESYYAGDGLNKAHITPEEIRNVLIKSKAQR
ncbi:MAG TPA: hypothetical protein VF691_21070, partial [Cytophagaceae bacterium]